MGTSVPLVLEEDLSCSPFANDWDYLSRVERSSSPVVLVFLRNNHRVNSDRPNSPSCRAFIRDKSSTEEIYLETIKCLNAWLTSSY